MIKKLSKNLIPISIIIAGFLIAGAVIFINQKELKEETPELLSSQKVAERALDYINKTVLKGKTVASLIDIVEENGLYKIKFDIEEQEITTYISRDGELLFPEAIAINPLPIKEIPKQDVPDVKLFVMSFCSYGNQAEEIMYPVKELLQEKVKIELHYVIYSNYGTGYPDYCLDKENKYCSMHGIGELNQGVRELCVYKYQNEKFWDFLMKINKECSAKNVDEKWEEVARSLGIDVQKIKDCQTNEAISLLKQELELTQKEYEVQNPSFHKDKSKERILGSPALVINGLIYDGERTPEGYKNGICSAFKNPPEECNQSLKSLSLGSGGGSCK